MSITFDIAGRVNLTVTGADDAAERSMVGHMDPYTPAQGARRATELIVQCGADLRGVDELINPARDGVTTGVVGGEHVLVRNGVDISVPAHGVGRATVRVGAGGSVGSIIRSVIRPALQISMLDADAVAIHAACVQMDGKAVAVAGWSETGKTEVALGLMELGGRFISDKWTVIGDDRTAATFPIGVGVRRWVLDALPTLRGSLPAGARARMRGAAVMGVLTTPLRHLGRGRIGSLVGTGVTRGVMIADRVALTPNEIAAAYGHTMDATATTALDTVVLLSTIPEGEVQIDEVDAQWVARRLAITAQYERREYFDLIERARYGGIDGGQWVRSEVERREREFLTRVLDGVRLLRVRVPFPSDPRPAAAAIAERVAL